MISLIAISVLLAACGSLLLWDHFADGQRHAVARRLEAINKGAGPGPSGNSADLALPLLFRIANLESHFEVLGWRYSGRKLAYGTAVLALIFTTLAFFWGMLVALAVMAAIMFGTVIGIRFLAHHKAAKFVDEFPDFVDRIRQLIIAGNSVAMAYDKAMRYCTPIQLRFLEPVAVMVSHGVPLYDALHQRASQLNIAELFLFTAIVRTNMRFGGDLSSSLSHFQTTLLNRLRAHKEFKAMTSELRMTTVILMALPLVAGIGIFLLNPHYLEFFVNAPQGKTAVTFICASVAAGLYFVRKLTKIEY